METRPKRLLMIAAIIVGLTLYWGCSQQEQILSDKTQTVLELDFERMPTNPPGLVYGLGVAKELTSSAGGADSVSGAMIFATFGFDFDLRMVTDVAGNRRADSGRFVLDHDLFDYGYLFVSVQKADGSGPEIGPIMLMDQVSDPFDDPIYLVFPYSNENMYSPDYEFTEAWTYYHMMAISDDTGQGDDSPGAFVTNGAAVWFNSVLFTAGQLQDTNAMISYRIDTTWHADYGTDTCRTFIVRISNVTDTTVRRGFGLDTFDQAAVRYDVELETWCFDTLEEDPLLDSLLSTEVHFVWDTGQLIEFDYFDQVQIGGEFKDPTGFGWKYEGWVLSDLVTGNDLGGLTPPAWVSYNTSQDSLIRGADGKLISTGQFVALDQPDDANPYVMPGHVVPPYPGEDFLINLPTGVSAPLQLVPAGETRSHGSILITLEPSNRISGQTNFPLIVNVGALPGSRAAVEASTQGTQGALYNKTNTNAGAAAGTVLQGFPVVRVDINRM